VQRILVGIITLVLFGLAGLMTWLNIGTHESAAICARVGFVMAALWVAMPRSGGPINWWLVGFGLVLMLGFARLPRAVKLIGVASLPFLAASAWIIKKRRG
jgi:hypothetical protein